MTPEPDAGSGLAAAGLPATTRQVRPISLRRRIRATFAVAIVAAVIMSGAGVFGFWALLDAREEVVDRADPALLASADLLTSLVDQETGIRAYVLTADERFLAPYEDGQHESDEARDRIERLAGELPGLSDDIDDVDRAIEAWRAEYVVPTVEGVAAGDATVRDEATLVEGKTHFDDIRTEVGELRSSLGAARDDARERMSATTFRLVGILVVAGLVLVLVVAFLWRLIRLGVEGPLHLLGKDAQVVSSGDFGHPVQPVGPVELQALGEAMEQMRRRIVADLEAVVVTRDELARKTKDLERSNSELEQFAYVASHDLQEPLRKVASFCQLLQSRYQGQLDERAHQYIEFAVDGAKRMQSLINDLLEFSRVGRRSGEMVVVDADDLVARALVNLVSAVEDTGADITSDDLPEVRVEPSLGVALFQNLVANAIKFRRPGTAPTVRITVRRDGDVHEFAVADDGIGIAPEYAERIFVIFQRLHAKDEYAGTGIGLALCRKIVEHHGGRIWVDTSGYATGDGHGATVRFTLPAVETAVRGDA